MARVSETQEAAMRWADAHRTDDGEALVIAHPATERSLARKGWAVRLPAGAMILTKEGEAVVADLKERGPRALRELLSLS
ncbi:hypothetical protein [Streptomyces flavidovirens]|uniref:hypothetical protein n=1 Tax=Streptomyces flavidovirens TaxID=67298 RepID=UPI0036939FE2